MKQFSAVILRLGLLLTYRGDPFLHLEAPVAIPLKTGQSP